MPPFGFGDKQYDLWWIVVSTITLGVGIGVLAQPQLVVRFMTVRSRRELNRAVLVGGLFILIMTGVAFTVGSLSNAFFAKEGKPFVGQVAKTIDADKGHVVLQLMKKDETGKWVNIEGKMAPVVLCEADLEQSAKEAGIVAGRSISVVYAKGNPDQIIPTYITSAMPPWFGLVFLLTLLAAAMSTLSSQFHTVGTSIGRDVYEQITGRHGGSININRAGIVIGIIIAMLWSYYARGGYIIARATAIFFGLCASAFLPAFVGGLFLKRITKPAAIASIVSGFTVTAFWLLFVKAKEAQAIGLVQKFTGGKPSILADHPNWSVVDPLVVALPISIIVVVVVTFLTKPPTQKHLAKCFEK
jgi:SSS family solute:Na+ symporter